MSLHALLQELKGNGIHLALNTASELSIKAPKGVLTPELKHKLQTHKSNIIALLTQHGKSDRELERIIPDVELAYEPFPMSDLQMGFYMADNDYMEFHVRPHYYSEIDYNNFDSNGYERAWNKMLALHKGSIGILNNDGLIEPLKEIPHYHIAVHDFSNLSTAERQEKMLAIRQHMERRQLPLKQWPWFDLQISVWHEDNILKGRVHYNNNNFFTDGCCTMRMMAKTKEFYNNPSLVPIPFPLKTRDYVLAMQRLENSSIGQNAKHYWESRLADLPPPPAVPMRPNMNRRVESHMHRRLMKLSPTLWQAFKINAQHHGLTPSNAVTAIYAQILSHWSNSRHFILGHMVTRRFPMHDNVFDIMGCFPSVYPLEVDWRNGDTFLQCAKLLQQRISLDVENLSWGGMRVLQSLSSINGGLGRSPCPFVTSSGLFLEFVESPTYGCLETSQALIDHQFWDLPDGTFVVAWDLLEEFFPAGIVDTMWDRYEFVLNRLANEKEFWTQPHLTLTLTPECQLNVRQPFNTIESDVPVGLIHRQLAIHAKYIPNKKALITDKKTFTYAELFYLSNKIAAKIQLNSAKQNQLIAILADKGWEQIVGTLGILISGAAYVPLSPTLPQARLAQIIQDADIKIVIAQDQHKLITEQLPVKTFSVAEILAEAQLVESCEVVQSPDDLAYVIYTSGSTGTPKGVMIKHSAALNTLLDINERFNVTADDIIFGISAFNFDLSVYDLFGAIEVGATLVLPSGDDIYNPAAWAKSVSEHHVSVWNSTPAIMQLLVDYYLLKQEEAAQLRLVMMSGDWIPITLPTEINRYAPNAKVISLGGATEASIWSIYYPIDHVENNWQSIPYGYPLKNQPWHILNSHYQPCPDFVAGQLYIGGVGLAEGYWGDIEKTQKAFIHHPVTNERLYATGDLGCYHPNGCIEFLGRADFQVKIQGFRIELGEIETVLIQHTRVTDAVVVAKDDGRKGKRLVAYVVENPPANDALTASEIRLHLAEKLPDYMVPSTIIMVAKIPLTANGKVDRKSLMDIDDVQTNAKPDYLAPRNCVEEELTNIWQSVMELDRIGVCDDFFELGGQSFSAIRIMTKILERYSQNFSLGLIMEGRTIEYLANAISHSDHSHKPQSLVTIKKQGKSNPLFFVHPAGGNVLCYQGLAQSLENPFYGLQATGLNPGEVALRNIESMAANYIEAIKTIQQQGPYIIGGWSSGGMIAHAIAKQLETQGDHVEHLLLIDTPAPLQYEDVSAVTLVSWFLEDLNIGFPISQIPKHQLQHSTEISVLDDLLEYVDIGNYLPEGLTINNLKIIFTVFSGIIVGCRQYVPTSIDADILLVRAKDGIVSEFADHPSRLKIDWGWAGLTSSDVKVISVEGTHYTLLEASNLPIVAETINSICMRDKKIEELTTA